MPGTARLENLRDHALSAYVPSVRSAEGELLWFRGWSSASAAATVYQRRTAARSFQLENSTPVIDSGELIVGKPCYRPLSGSETQELESARAAFAAIGLDAGGQGSHMAVDYELLLQSGIRGVQDSIRRRLEGLQAEDEKAEFYRCCIQVLEAVVRYAESYSRYAAGLAEACQDEARRLELTEIAAVCARVPAGPAESFRDALQSVHFLTMCLEGLYQLGRPDRYLLDIYRRDLESEVLSTSVAQELIDCVCILFNEYIPKGLAVGFMVGGKDARGDDVCNELTRMFLESISHTRMIYPGIGLCWTDATPDDITLRSSELLAEGYSHPALFNDRIITEGLMSYGLPADEACDESKLPPIAGRFEGLCGPTWTRRTLVWKMQTIPRPSSRITSVFMLITL